MNKINKLLLISSVVAFIFSSCMSPPSSQELASADYGPKPTIQQLRRGVAAYGERILIDPMSAQYNIHPYSQKAWAVTEESNGSYGWVFSGSINAKNRFGGYVGSKPFKFLYKRGVVESITYSHLDGMPFNHIYKIVE